MTPPLTDAELAAAEKLCEAATPGPWRECKGEVLIADAWVQLRKNEDAALIAASRSLLPRLVAELREARAEVVRLQARLVPTVVLASALAKVKDERNAYRGELTDRTNALESKLATSEEERRALEGRLAEATEALDEFYRRAT
jgi:predicted nuclease with TOPRIM domain